MSDLLQQIRNVHNQALAELSEMKRTIDYAERDDDYECGHADRYEEVAEMYENLVDEIAKILRDADIDSVMTSKPVVSEKQYPLPIKFTEDKNNG